MSAVDSASDAVNFFCCRGHAERPPTRGGIIYRNAGSQGAGAANASTKDSLSKHFKSKGKLVQRGFSRGPCSKDTPNLKHLVSCRGILNAAVVTPV